MSLEDRAESARTSRQITLEEEVEARKRLLEEKPFESYSAEESAIALGLELMQSEHPQTRLRGRCLRDIIGPLTNILTEAHCGKDFKKSDEFVEPLMGIIAHMLLMVVGPIAPDKGKALRAGADYLVALAEERVDMCGLKDDDHV